MSCSTGCASVASRVFGSANDGAVVVVVAEVEGCAGQDGLSTSPAVHSACVDLGCGVASHFAEACVVAALQFRAAFGFVFPVVLGAVAAYGDVWASRLGADAFGACHVCLPA